MYLLFSRFFLLLFSPFIFTYFRHELAHPEILFVDPLKASAPDVPVTFAPVLRVRMVHNFVFLFASKKGEQTVFSPMRLRSDSFLASDFNWYIVWTHKQLKKSSSFEWKQFMFGGFSFSFYSSHL